MHKKLLLDAFEKAREMTSSDKLTHRSTHLSDFINEDSGEPYGEKILRINFNKIEKNPDEKIHLKKHVVESLSHYLGFEDYSGFVIKNKPDVKKRDSKKVIWIALIILIPLITIFIANAVNRPKWMQWQTDHYEEADFDSKKLSNGNLKIYKEERILNFKKIEPDCKTEFFNSDKSENLWYGKNPKGKYEYFTALGRHPETGKTLKKITVYMIKKHICELF